MLPRPEYPSPSFLQPALGTLTISSRQPSSISRKALTLPFFRFQARLMSSIPKSSENAPTTGIRAILISNSSPLSRLALRWGIKDGFHSSFVPVFSIISTLVFTLSLQPKISPGNVIVPCSPAESFSFLKSGTPARSRRMVFLSCRIRDTNIPLNTPPRTTSSL